MVTHPFFNIATYPWYRSEAQQLHRALCNAIQSPGLIDLRYKTCAPGLPQLPVGIADLMWKEALEKLTLANALRDLCTGLLADGALRAIHGAVQQVVDARSVSSSILLEDVPFFDRDSLRKKLERLRSPTDPLKVLLVRGGRKTGKSFGRFLLEAVAREESADSTYACEGLVVSVHELIERLFAVLNATAPKSNTTDDAWYRAVCVAMMRAAVANRRVLWVIVDDLAPDSDGVMRLDEQIRRFCNIFALNMLDRSFRTWFRLVLIDYPAGEPTRWERQHWEEDNLDNQSILAEHLADVIRRTCETRKLRPMQEWVDDVASDILAGAPVDPQLRLQYFQDQLQAVLGRLR